MFYNILQKSTKLRVEVNTQEGAKLNIQTGIEPGNLSSNPEQGYLDFILRYKLRKGMNTVQSFGSLVKVEPTYWGVLKLFNMQNKLMDVHQSDISKILPFPLQT